MAVTRYFTMECQHCGTGDASLGVELNLDEAREPVLMYCSRCEHMAEHRADRLMAWEATHTCGWLRQHHERDPLQHRADHHVAMSCDESSAGALVDLVVAEHVPPVRAAKLSINGLGIDGPYYRISTGVIGNIQPSGFAWWCQKCDTGSWPSYLTNLAAYYDHYAHAQACRGTKHLQREEVA